MDDIIIAEVWKDFENSQYLALYWIVENIGFGTCTYEKPNMNCVDDEDMGQAFAKRVLTKYQSEVENGKNGK